MRYFALFVSELSFVPFLSFLSPVYPMFPLVTVSALERDTRVAAACIGWGLLE